MSVLRMICVTLPAFLLITACSQPAEPPAPETSMAPEPPPEVDPLQALIERGKRLELDTPYVPPPGDPDANRYVTSRGARQAS